MLNTYHVIVSDRTFYVTGRNLKVNEFGQIIIYNADICNDIIKAVLPNDAIVVLEDGEKFPTKSNG